MFWGALFMLILVYGGMAIKEGALDNIYLIIIALLAILYPILFGIYLVDGDKELIQNAGYAFPLMAIITFAEIGGLGYWTKKKFLTIGTKNYNKYKGYILIGILVAISLIIIIRIAMILM